MAKLEVDANGLVTTAGRFQGRHIDEVMNYLEGLEAAVADPGHTPPPAAPPAATNPPSNNPPREDPAKAMVDAAAARLDPMQQMMFARLEQDDEEAFSREVSDYAKYKQAIDEIKTGNQVKGMPGMHPAARAQKGVHRMLYIHVKSQDENVRKRIFEEVKPPAQETPEEKAAREEAERLAAAASAAPPTRTPRPAPPTLPPTPSNRPAPQPPQNNRKPKLQPNDKIIRFCRANSLNVDTYLIKLEDQGVTQEQLDNAGQMGARPAPRSVYDRTRATRS